MTTSLIFQAYFIVLVSSFAISASRERISAFVDLSNSSLFRIERIRKLSLQITEAKNYAFDIVVLERNTRKDKKSDVIRPEEVIVSPNPKDGTYEFTVSSEDEIVKWISKNTPQMVLCFAQDIRMPYAIINARRKEFLSPKVKIISVMEDVSNSYHSYKNGVQTLEKIAEVLMFSDYTIFTNARDQKFLKEQFQNGKFDIPSRSLLKKLESGIVLHHVSSIKDLIMASRPRDAVSLDRVWAKTKRIRRDIQESNAPNSGSNVSSTSPSPTKSSNSSFVAISPTTSTNITLTPSSKTSSNSTVEAESPTTSTNMTFTSPSTTTSSNFTVAVSPTTSSNINLTLSTTVSSNSTFVLAASLTPTNMTYTTPSTTTSSNFTIVAVYPTPSINMSTSPSTTSSNSTVETASPTPTNMTMSSSTTPLNSTAVAVYSTPSTNMTFTSPFPTSSNSTVIAASPASSNMTFITPSPTSSKSIVVAASPTTSSNMTYTTPSTTSSKSIVVAASPTSSSNMTTSPSTTSSNSTVVAASPSTSTNMTMSPPTKSSNSTVLAASPSTSTNMTMSPPTKSSNSTIVAASPTTSTNMSYTTPSTTTSSNSTVVAASPTASANMTTSPSTTSSNSTVLAASLVITSSATFTTISSNITVVATSQAIITSHFFSIDNQSVSIYPTSSVTYFPPTSATPLMTTTVSFISNKSISIEQPSNATSSAPSSTTVSMKTTVSFSSKSTVPPSPNATSFPQISSTPVSTTVSYIGKQSSSVELKPNATVTESSSAMSPVLQQSSETPTRQTQLVTTLAPMFSTSIRMSTTALPLVTSAVISSSILSTTIQIMTPTPSSVQSVITTPSMTIAPPTKDDEKYIITLEGNCQEILDNTDSLKKFQEEFKKVIASVAMILENEVEILYTKCGSINVTFIVRNAKVRNTTALLKKAASEGKIQIVVDGKNYTSSGLVVIPLTEPTVKPSSKIIPTTEPDNKLALYLYITFGAVMGLVFLIGLIVLVVRCKKDKTSGSFSLGSDTDVELKRFGGIPRASYYRVEMYGEPVEVDAARSGVSNDEYEGDIVPYGQTTFSSNSTARSTNVNANKDEFTMGNLPEWNVPKLKSSDMVVNSPSKNSKGAGQNENDKVNDDDVDNDTGLHAYDNPVMTFGDPNANSFD